MKKIYILAFAVVGMALSANAQIIQDDMESYFLGPIQEGHWGTWEGSDAERLQIVNTHAKSGTQSGMIGGDGLQDVILRLGNETDGEFTLSYQMYIPTGKGAYYNFQENQDPGNGAWAINVYFNPGGGNPGLGAIYDDANPANQVSDAFTFPEDEWFKITNHIDLDADTIIMYLNGVVVYDGAFYSGSSLGGLDIYSIDANNEVYIDDVFFDFDFLSTSDFTADSFSVYPNPVTDVLNINSKVAVDNVVVYDILGKIVLQETPGTISPTINMSALPSGAYMVKVTINNTSKTVKVLK